MRTGMRDSDSSSEKPNEFAEWLHGQLVKHYARETQSWALERAARVMARLNACRADGEPKEAVILALRGVSAFTFAGRYIYVERHLYERLPSDEAVAYVCAHEIAHHDCGHLSIYNGWSAWIPRSSATTYLAALTAFLEHLAYGPEKEGQADIYGMQLCLDAGYDGGRCMQVFDILENESLDAGDVDGVFGPENLLDPTDPERDRFSYQIQRWLWTRQRGYLPLRERRERVAAYLEKRATWPEGRRGVS